ncbi:unnamed protein product [Rotaria socialis]|uniref:Uncharacterized protein n=1 Tax=Rotaria socialis TaxID=392032 RepID=A0A820CFN9_9BILA|nr:unnamed protein product [Rotaria socialis]CAF4524619.1 unnamed protein product [Rotaria socialis]
MGKSPNEMDNCPFAPPLAMPLIMTDRDGLIAAQLYAQEAQSPTNKKVWYGSLKFIAAGACAMLVMLIIGATIVLSLIPVYLQKKDLTVIATCSTCSVDVYNKFTYIGTVYNENVGYYSCAQFCAGSLTGGASGADDPTYNYINDTASSLGGVSYSCYLAQRGVSNCVNSYGSFTTQSGLFDLGNSGVCSSPYAAYRCCCRSNSG